MNFDTLIVNGTVATATDTYAADVAISGGKIAELSGNLPSKMLLNVTVFSAKILHRL